MKTTNGKLRNITSGILHTGIGEVYNFFESYLGMDGIMTHQLPSACKALQPILKNKLSKDWFTNEWIKDQNWQNTETEVPDLTAEEKQEFWKEYEVFASAMWDSIKDKTVVINELNKE